MSIYSVLHISPRRWQHGMSLLEVLAGVAIVGALAAVLIPGLSRMTASSRNVGCISNLRQYGIAFTSFANDNGYFPTGASSPTWFSQLQPYLGAKGYEDEGRLRCPAFAAVMRTYYPDPKDDTVLKRRGYQYNRNLNPGTSDRRITAVVGRAPLTPLLWETPGTSKDISGYPGGGAYVKSKYRHDGRMNLLMVTGEIVSRQGNYNPDESIGDENLPVERDGIEWGVDGKPFYWEYNTRR